MQLCHLVWLLTGALHSWSFIPPPQPLRKRRENWPHQCHREAKQDQAARKGPRPHVRVRMVHVLA